MSAGERRALVRHEVPDSWFPLAYRDGQIVQWFDPHGQSVYTFVDVGEPLIRQLLERVHIFPREDGKPAIEVQHSAEEDFESEFGRPASPADYGGGYAGAGGYSEAGEESPPG